MAKQCTHIKPNGDKCKAYALTEGDYCWAHDPDKREARRIASAKGGRAGARPKTPAIVVEIVDDKADGVDLESFEDLRRFCNKMIRSVISKCTTTYLSQNDTREIRHWTELLMKLEALSGGSAKDRLAELEELAAEVQRKRLSG